MSFAEKHAYGHGASTHPGMIFLVLLVRKFTGSLPAEHFFHTSIGYT
jgi:hypothetical protein